MKGPMFDQFCKAGEEADRNYKEGNYLGAHKAYVKLLSEIDSLGDIDSYLLAKVTLGLIRTHLKMGQIQQAFAIWNSDIDDSLFGIGIYALENAQTNVPDLISYDLVCAYLHSVSESRQDSSGRAVNQYMSRVCEHALEDGDKELMKLAISNWKQHLKQIYSATLPMHLAQPLIEFEKQLPEPVRLQALDFGPVSPWQRPQDFRELSRVVEFRPLRFDQEQQEREALQNKKAAGQDYSNVKKFRKK